jgi:heme-degrading monooxygenase HmoA
LRSPGDRRDRPSAFRALAAAAGLAAGLAAAAPAAAEVTLIDVFEVPPGKEAETVAAWEAARDFLAERPGYVSTALHRAPAPDARFRLINVATWESADAVRAAIAAMQRAGAFPNVEGLGVDPALYEIVRTDAPAAGLDAGLDAGRGAGLDASQKGGEAAKRAALRPARARKGPPETSPAAPCERSPPRSSG